MKSTSLLIGLLMTLVFTLKPLTVIGHRGACGYEPENTLRSFQKALDLGVDVIEFDVFVCKSGEVVVIHDPKIDRTTNGNGLVANLTLEQIQSYDAGLSEVVPTLEQVLDLINHKAIVDIELKGEATPAAVARIIEYYIANKGWSETDFIVTSFNHHLLAEFHQICPKIARGAIINAIPLTYAEFGSNVGAQAIVVCKEFINKAYVNDAHKRGLKVYVYTVNEPDEIDSMKELGVDGIVSNYPDRISN